MMPAEHDLGDDHGDDACAQSQVGGDHVPPAAHAAALLLRRAMPRSLLRRLRRGAPTALVIRAPDADSTRPLRAAFLALVGRRGEDVEFAATATWRSAPRADLAVFVRATPDRSGRVDVSGGCLPEHLAAGGSAVGIAADTGLLPPQLLTAADATLEIGRLTGRDLAGVIRATTRCKVAGGLDDDFAASLTLAEIGMGVRAGTTPSACVARLRTMLERRVSVVHNDTPRLEDLAGYGEAFDWGMSLRADVEDRRADPSSVPLDSITRSLLLVGPPGTGKTQFAHALGRTCDIPVILTSYADWQAGDNHLGIVMANLRANFAKARELAHAPGLGGIAAGCILAIDELDSIPSREDGSGDRNSAYMAALCNAMLTLAEKGADARRGVILLGISNFPDRIDPALARPGRFHPVVRVGRPDPETFVRMIRTWLGPGVPDSDLLAIAHLVPVRSGAEAARIVQDARRAARRAGREEVGFEDLLVQVAPPERRPAADVRRIAIHEAGHALACLELGIDLQSLSTVADAHSGGRTSMTNLLPGCPLQTDFERAVVMVLAGRAAEEVCLGAPSAGARHDIVAASELLALMHLGGLGGRLGVSLAGEASEVLRADPRLRRAVDGDLARLAGRARSIVAARRLEIEMVARAAVRRRFLSAVEVRAVLSRVRRADAMRMVAKGRLH